MGDMGDAFRAFKEHKQKMKRVVEPRRMEFAKQKLYGRGYSIYEDGKKMSIAFEGGCINFFPYTGWYQGEKAYGKIKGRGIDNLIKKLEEITKEE